MSKKVGKLILILSLLLLASCSSIGDMIGSQAANAPSWYPGGRSRRGQVCFTAHGSGASEEAAREAAYDELLGTISSYIGEDVSGSYYRELSANRSIEELSLEIDRTEVGSTVDGSFHYYILAYADEAVISSQRSAEYQAYLDAEAQVVSMRNESLSYYRDNQDVDAVSTLIQAIPLSWQHGISSEGNRVDDLMSQAMEYLGALRFRLSRTDEDTGSVRVRLVRDRGLLSPVVVGAPVRADFSIREHRGGTAPYSIPYQTDRNGYFNFEEDYPPMVNTGTVTFSVDLEAVISRAEAVTGTALFEPMRALIDDRSASFDYDIASAIDVGAVLVVMNEYDEAGHQLPSSYASDAFTSYLEAEGIGTETNVGLSADDDMAVVLDRLLSDYSSYEWIVLSNVGLSNVSVQPSDGTTVYVAEGYTMLLNTRTRSVEYLDEITREVSWQGATREENLQQVFSIYGSSVAVNIASFF